MNTSKRQSGREVTIVRDDPSTDAERSEWVARWEAADSGSGREVMIELSINGKDSDEFCLSEFELNEEPETSCYDVSQAIAKRLNIENERAAVAIRIFGSAACDPRLTFEFINGRRGWEARRVFETWLQRTLTIMSEHEAEHGPISSEANRRDTARRLRNDGVVS